MDEKETPDNTSRPGGLRRRRTREIPACLVLLATAAALAGCEDRRDCVDRFGHKVADTDCGHASHGGGFYFLYGGRGGRSLGDTITGGSTTRSIFRGGTMRGGFGSGGEGGGE